MEQLKKYISDIYVIANQQINNNEKSAMISKLLTDYYKFANKLNVEPDEINDLILFLKNKSFIIQSPIKEKNIDLQCFSNLKYALENNIGIKETDAINILNWTVNNTLSNLDGFLKFLGTKVWQDNLDGYCELCQSISLIPLEKLGLKVTKNTAQDCFMYPFNHAFGTVTFPINMNNNIIYKTYLVDVSYRQFFSTAYCNEGMYYTKRIAPDPGYFTDKDFASELLSNGFIELNSKTAELYGLPFYKSSLSLGEKNKVCNINFYEQILTRSSNYLSKDFELIDFNLEIPSQYKK